MEQRSEAWAYLGDELLCLESGNCCFIRFVDAPTRSPLFCNAFFIVWVTSCCAWKAVTTFTRNLEKMLTRGGRLSSCSGATILAVFYCCKNRASVTTVFLTTVSFAPYSVIRS